jgi:hypothetical protein
MSDKPKRKRSPKHRLTLPDWRWRLIILLALYGFIMLPVFASEYIYTESLLPVGIAAVTCFGMGYVSGWYEKHISNPLLSLKACLASFSFLVFTLISFGLLIISSGVWLLFTPYFSSLSLLAIMGLPVLIVIHIGIAGEKLANRNYQQRNQPKAKREYASTERLSDEYDVVDDDSFDVIEQSESNEEQQKFDSLEC